MRLDLPADGYPTSAMSASVFSSRTSRPSQPGVPSRANPGALRFGDDSAALPSPPRPPCAATYVMPGSMRSTMTSPSGFFTTVPTGTGSSSVSPCAPERMSPMPNPPFSDFRCGRWW